MQQADLPASEDQIRMRAYELYLERGGESGDDVSDWLRAEREFLEQPNNRALSVADGTRPTERVA